MKLLISLGRNHGVLYRYGVVKRFSGCTRVRPLCKQRSRLKIGQLRGKQVINVMAYAGRHTFKAFCYYRRSFFPYLLSLTFGRVTAWIFDIKRTAGVCMKTFQLSDIIIFWISSMQLMQVIARAVSCHYSWSVDLTRTYVRWTPLLFEEQAPWHVAPLLIVQAVVWQAMTMKVCQISPFIAFLWTI